MDIGEILLTLRVQKQIIKKMANNNKGQQEENAIEKLNSNLTSASEKIAQNQKTIYIVVALIVAIALGIMAYIFLYRNPRTKSGFEAYNQIEISAMGNDSIAAAEYAKVADKYSGTDAAELAALSAAESYYNMGKYNEAVKYLDQFSTSEPVLAASALILKGDCYVNLKKYDDALSAYDKAISKQSDNSQIVPRVLLKEANVYEAQKQNEKALECYEKIAKDFPTFQLGNGVGIDAYVERAKARLGK